jgi:UDP-N-acetylglucosamine--dolichyl-phosphate N-acetylglucosaminephosphotransferase
VYASMLSIFCMNSINIYAGINGLEVGQSIIIGFGVVFINVIEMYFSTSVTHTNNQFLSIFIIVPFLTVSICLLYFNKYHFLLNAGTHPKYSLATPIATSQAPSSPPWAF